MNITNLCYGGGGGSWLRVSVPVVAILIRNDSARILKERCSLMVCHDARRLLRWEVEGFDELQRLRCATIWCQHLWTYRPVFVKPVTPAQEAKTVVASGAAVLIFTAVSLHSNVSSVVTTSQSSGGRASASVHPAHKTLVDSSRRVRCIVCSAAAASVGFWSCVGKRAVEVDDHPAFGSYWDDAFAKLFASAKPATLDGGRQFLVIQCVECFDWYRAWEVQVQHC